MKQFYSIVNLLKVNNLERSDPIYNGKNVHELVREIETKLNALPPKSGIKDFVPEDIKLPLAHLFVSKELVPPFFFSWEFMGGTYFPFLSPFIISLLQIGYGILKKKFTKYREAKKK